MLIILMGKSGVGKSTIEKYILKEKEFEKVVTYTTRPKRKKEKNGNHYFFVSDNNFEKMKNDGKFFETVDRQTIVNNKPVVWHYGSPKKRLDNDKDYCIVLDYEGAESYIQHFGVSNCFVIELQLDEELRKERAMRRNTFEEVEWKERCIRDNKQFDNRKDISNFTLNTLDMSIEEVTSAILLALTEYKKNVKGDYRKVKIVRKFCDTHYWEQPEIVYVSEFVSVKTDMERK